ncbi:aminomethyl-transferring glycine dehydrogenase subunit GcvPA [Sphingomonadales bacterium 56]|uniref:aminomethyl-transferring glycine dehydrogenase subunit GcvPA n=1 Tax=unclassified Sphingobium TaxID=2611147 RepID=UPI00191A0667|nr:MULTISPECIES: aminomethyl-transferring glycine dehydrogenase subunit GcvPA [unclassified Sphingobium]MBY2928462.1 aminomethyl-transferring glycine dehydrogenase subunit GcvPA [Sphingomonadales bacterium 56]MBY2959690.1 aminomethyl-transferring glycine dehydrogenase subunit GcvPA [Sphingomonadales bacterium 58]CAD7337353.1 putative glycine dehydrogenase (decarboxylating) subunit 1 [Sphingobium sp. S6]CAD7339505.1 putative glycine dehydrogenase (decarboxylating) subunit 1 [Sphingobium sp. S8]
MRYLPLTDSDRQDMLSVIGASSIDDLFIDVPAEARLSGKIPGLPDHASELSVERHMAALARKNLSAGEAPFFLGAGAYRHHVPASVDHLIQRGEFLTAYTPYQPEIAQGTLQVLFEFQTQVARLLGCDVANASMYDGSTACWEAIGMARRITKRGKAILSSGLHPHYVSVAKTMAKFTGDALVHEAPTLDAAAHIDALIAGIDKDTSCVVVQYPDILGRIADLTPLAAAAHEAGALLVAVVTEPVALGAIKAPGHMGADIVVGEGQSIGVGLQFGGPYLGLFACKQKYVRQMPGRLCGETVDAAGKRGFVLTLSTREQHIRREKATSNICTNSGLCALAFSIHMTLLGEKGLRELAMLNHGLAVQAAERLAQVPGVELLNGSFFNEFTLVLSKDARETVRNLADKGVLGGVSLGRLFPDAPEIGNGLVVAVTETVTAEDIEALARALEEELA